jgi:hypothetical protein
MDAPPIVALMVTVVGALTAPVAIVNPALLLPLNTVSWAGTLATAGFELDIQTVVGAVATALRSTILPIITVPAVAELPQSPRPAIVGPETVVAG